MARPAKPKTALAQRLIELRGDHTKEEFATALGVNPGTYANYERGISEPKVELLDRIADLFNADLHWLLTGKPAPNSRPTKAIARAPASQSAVIDPDLLKQIARIITRAHAEAQIRLPADAQATELANAYNLLMAKAEDPADILELKSLLPWLETHLTKNLRQALKEPGAGKREA
jgi:transcriptional regulator with XRE-family HTH domain